jgi:hypothetical protein
MHVSLGQLSLLWLYVCLFATVTVTVIDAFWYVVAPPPSHVVCAVVESDVVKLLLTGIYIFLVHTAVSANGCHKKT